MVDQVSNEELRSSDVPAHDADWPEIVKFAGTFPGPTPVLEDHEVARRYRNSGFWQGTLTELRGRLYRELRSFHDSGEVPSDAELERIRDLLDAIRLALTAKPAH